MLIGKRGATRKMLEEASGAGIVVDSESGDVMADWGEQEVDPILRMKMPDVIRAIGRGLAPKRAVKLLEDEIFLRIYDIREWVGRQPNQTRRMRSRLIGRDGRIRSLIEEISRTVASGAHCALVIDRAGWHTSAKLKRPRNITLIPLPPYAPELNPTENVWQYLRQNYLALRVLDDYDAIVEACCKAWNDLLATPDQLASITRRNWANVS